MNEFKHYSLLQKSQLTFETNGFTGLRRDFFYSLLLLGLEIYDLRCFSEVLQKGWTEPAFRLALGALVPVAARLFNFPDKSVRMAGKRLG